MRPGNIEQRLFYLKKEIQSGNYEGSFKTLLSLKDYVHNNELWGTFYYKSIIFQMMAEICIKESKSHHFFYYKCQSIFMDIAKELVGNPPFFEQAENIIMNIYKGKHIEQNELVFVETSNHYFDNNDKFGKFILDISFNLLLKNLIPGESHKYFFYVNPNDQTIPINSNSKEIIETYQIFKCADYIKQLDVFTTVSNITALSGYRLNQNML